MVPGARIQKAWLDRANGSRIDVTVALVEDGEVSNTRQNLNNDVQVVVRPASTSGGCRMNASDTEPARLLAVLIVDAADEQLTIPDPQ
jgi:hypothetical protein